MKYSELGELVRMIQNMLPKMTYIYFLSVNDSEKEEVWNCKDQRFITTFILIRAESTYRGKIFKANCRCSKIKNKTVGNQLRERKVQGLQELLLTYWKNQNNFLFYLSPLYLRKKVSFSTQDQLVRTGYIEGINLSIQDRK